jgi:hypothetical protein
MPIAPVVMLPIITSTTMTERKGLSSDVRSVTPSSNWKKDSARRRKRNTIALTATMPYLLGNRKKRSPSTSAAMIIVLTGHERW